MEKNGDENNDVIDETKIESGDISQYIPRGRFIIKTLGDISKLFISVSFLLIAMIVLIGLYDSKFSIDVLVLLWDKIAAVYLVIFGHWLGKDR